MLIVYTRTHITKVHARARHPSARMIIKTHSCRIYRESKLKEKRRRGREREREEKERGGKSSVQGARLKKRVSDTSSNRGLSDERPTHVVSVLRPLLYPRSPRHQELLPERKKDTINLLRCNDVPRTSRICLKIAIFSQFWVYSNIIQKAK